MDEEATCSVQFEERALTSGKLCIARVACVYGQQNKVKGSPQAKMFEKIEKPFLHMDLI